MDEKIIEEFINWLPNNVKEFKDKKPEEIVQVLNQLSETEEGKTQLEQMVTTFKQVKQTFKTGGKLDYLLSLKKGGKIKRCKCGCEIKKIYEKGGMIERCSCGCKK